MKTLKNILMVTGLTALGYIAGGISTLYDYEPKSANFRDIDEDGKDDIIITTRKNKTAHVLLERDGKYINFKDVPTEFYTFSERDGKYVPENIRRKVEDNIAKLRGFRMER